MGATPIFRSVGSTKPLLPSVLKGRNIEMVWQKSIICYIRAFILFTKIRVQFVVIHVFSDSLPDSPTPCRWEPAPSVEYSSTAPAILTVPEGICDVLQMMRAKTGYVVFFL